jgi:DNA polymerase (family 10)
VLFNDLSVFSSVFKYVVIVDSIRKLKLTDGQELAKKIVRLLTPLCERIEVAGSIRRRKAEVHDIDLVLIPKPLIDVVGILQRSMKAVVIKRGSRIVNLKINGVGVDLNFASKENFAPILLFRTGSEAHNEKLARKAKRLVLKFSVYGVFKDGKRIDDNTEEGIFSVLGESYSTPEERD